MKIFFSFIFLVYSLTVLFVTISRENIRKKYENLKDDYISLQIKYDNLKEKIKQQNNETDTF